MNLIIDIGNTFIKIAIIENEEIIWRNICKNIDDISANEEFISYHDVQYIIVSSVRNEQEHTLNLLQKKGISVLELNEFTLLPFENLYKTPHTLGKDRLAAASGAIKLFPKTNILVIDLGTAITFDFINSAQQFIGGNISPGLDTRYKALHEFTKKLPLLEKKETFPFLGNSTETAIIAGVQQGIIFEIDGYINMMQNKYPDLKVILTGGDAIFFEKKLKNTIFADSDLVFWGLNAILEYNINK